MRFCSLPALPGKEDTQTFQGITLAVMQRIFKFWYRKDFGGLCEDGVSINYWLRFSHIRLRCPCAEGSAGDLTEMWILILKPGGGLGH